MTEAARAEHSGSVRSRHSLVYRGVAALLTLAGCATDGTAHVGEPCVSASEDDARFSGFAPGEVNVEPAERCGRRNVCLVNGFQGRVSCPEGQTRGGGSTCTTPEGAPIDVDVPPQLETRPADEAVICSCRCDGPQRADYCKCPSGMRCEELIFGTPGEGFDEYIGSYCVY